MADQSAQTDAQAAPKVVRAHVTRVGDGYVNTTGIALIGGRSFMSDDGAGAPLVTVISKALADKLFPEGDTIGQRLTFESGAGMGRSACLTGRHHSDAGEAQFWTFPWSMSDRRKPRPIAPLGSFKGTRASACRLKAAFRHEGDA